MTQEQKPSMTVQEAARKYEESTTEDNNRPRWENRESDFIAGADWQASKEGWIDVKATPSPGFGWTTVEEGLPPKNDKYYYWLYSQSIDNYELGDYDYLGKYFVDKYGDRLYHVTHWMLPVPPVYLA